jgi:crossover junction endonuclease MUS81
MAPPAPMQHKVRLPENEEVARALHEKRLAMRGQPDGFNKNIDRTFGRAYRNVCDSTEPIRTVKEFSKIKYAKCRPLTSPFFFLRVAGVNVALRLGFD